MVDSNKRKLRMVTIVYWVLLLYIIAALGWWAFSLLHQNTEIFTQKKAALHSAAPEYAIQLANLAEEQKRGVYK